ncbi:hypothetical protein GCM10010492_06490 [Saccharothrix mutabilis subsp. mutabilis]|uniref:Peptidase M48 domain-containing protein n=1 Tax=Saccharothrix mutabilis subsp. mutabilis TaxID=66855 RepID=A0ABN0T3N1_9PSEU
MTRTGRAPARPWSAGVLAYPAATTLRVAMLVAVVLMAGVFVGDWLYLGSGTGLPAMVAPPVWLAVPPLVAVLAMLVLAAVTPAVSERRRGLVDVPEDMGRVARARLADLSAAAGLSRPPRLVWNRTAKGTGVRAYGLPGRYRIQVAPAALGLARRNPAVFDMLMRHELAHVRNHDIVPAAAARVAGHVVVGLLAVPVLWRVADRDLSMLPDFLVRAALLVVAVRMVRAAVLRAREHYADVRAASWSSPPWQDADRFTDAARRRAPRRGVARWFALHPAPARRAAVVREPNVLGRATPGELFTVGALTTAAQPLLKELVIALTGLDVLSADRLSHALAYAGLGAAVAAVVVRAAGCGVLGPRAVAGAIAALIAGAGTGAVTSLSVTGLPAGQALFAHVLTEVLVCTVAGGALLVLLVDVLHARPARRSGTVVVAGAAGAGLVVPGALALALAVAEGAAAALGGELALAFLGDPVTTAAGLALAIAAVLLLARAPGALRTGVLTGTAAGAVATMGAVALLLTTDPFATDEAAWRFYLGAVWTGVALSTAAAAVASASRREGAVLGIAAAATTGLVATAGLAVVWSVAGHPFDLYSVLITVRATGTTALFTSLPAAAAASLLRQFATAPRTRREVLAPPTP